MNIKYVLALVLSVSTVLFSIGTVNADHAEGYYSDDSYNVTFEALNLPSGWGGGGLLRIDGKASSNYELIYSTRFAGRDYVSDINNNYTIILRLPPGTHTYDFNDEVTGGHGVGDPAGGESTFTCETNCDLGTITVPDKIDAIYTPPYCTTYSFCGNGIMFCRDQIDGCESSSECQDDSVTTVNECVSQDYSCMLVRSGYGGGHYMYNHCSLSSPPTIKYWYESYKRTYEETYPGSREWDWVCRYQDTHVSVTQAPNRWVTFNCGNAEIRTGPEYKKNVGYCSSQTCPAGYTDANNDPSDGCEAADFTLSSVPTEDSAFRGETKTIDVTIGLPPIEAGKEHLVPESLFSTPVSLSMQGIPSGWTDIMEYLTVTFDPESCSPECMSTASVSVPASLDVPSGTFQMSIMGQQGVGGRAKTSPYVLTIKEAECGNGLCELTETADSCNLDCWSGLSVSLDPDTATVLPGETVESLATIIATGSSETNGKILISVDEDTVPEGVTTSLSVEECTSSCESVLSIKTSSDTPSTKEFSPYEIVVNAVSGTEVGSDIFELNVLPIECNNNGICEWPETQLTCPGDCKTVSHMPSPLEPGATVPVTVDFNDSRWTPDSDVILNLQIDDFDPSEVSEPPAASAKPLAVIIEEYSTSYPRTLVRQPYKVPDDKIGWGNSNGCWFGDQRIGPVAEEGLYHTTLKWPDNTVSETVNGAGHFRISAFCTLPDSVVPGAYRLIASPVAYP